MFEYGHEGHELKRRGNDGNAENERGHVARSATPQATKHAPAHRLTVTVSLSTSFARTVSSTTLAAVTGTEKLRSATESSFTKAKNEMAMKKTARTRGPRCARPASTRPSLPGRKSSAATTWRFISKLCSKS